LRLVGECGGVRSPPQGRRRIQPVLIPAAEAERESAMTPREIAAYDDLRYRDVFWAARSYEDACDRIALRALLPSTGGRLIEVGAGFGRLAAEYAGYDEVVLLDASAVHVAAAREALGGDPRFSIVSGDAYALPYPDASFDAAVCIRVLHHFEDPGPALIEIGRVVRPGGVLVLEFANKRNLKSIARRMLGRQCWSPFGPGSVAYKPFHFDHAPLSVRRSLRRSGFTIESLRAASLFRLPALTRRLPVSLLVGLETRLQGPLGSITPGPSVFLRARRSR
jgi:ubiquinone/menaquinone biosynthesis C-methylase UbiE